MGGITVYPGHVPALDVNYRLHFECLLLSNMTVTVY